MHGFPFHPTKQYFSINRKRKKILLRKKRQIGVKKYQGLWKKFFTYPLTVHGSNISSFEALSDVFKKCYVSLENSLGFSISLIK